MKRNPDKTIGNRTRNFCFSGCPGPNPALQAFNAAGPPLQYLELQIFRPILNGKSSLFQGRLHYLCISNRKFQNKAGIVLQFAVQLESVEN